MKATVNKKYRDKYTGELRSVGDEIEVTEERATEIMAAGNYITLLPEQEEEQLEQTEVKQAQTEEVAPVQPKKRRTTKR